MDNSNRIKIQQIHYMFYVKRIGGSTHQVHVEIGSTQRSTCHSLVIGVSREHLSKNMAFKLSFIENLVDLAN
ncbi:hypothetical protein AAZX31_02G150100 [Glycine max]